MSDPYQLLTLEKKQHKDKERNLTMRASYLAPYNPQFCAPDLFTRPVYERTFFSLVETKLWSSVRNYSPFVDGGEVYRAAAVSSTPSSLRMLGVEVSEL